MNIYGQEGDELEKLAKEFANKMSKVEGLTNLVMTDLRKRPEYSLVVDKGKSAMYGLSVKTVADSMHAQVRGMRPTKFHELSKGEEIETITRLQAIYRQKLDDLGQIYVQTHESKQVPLSEIANFYPSTGPTTIDRKDKHRYVFVKGDVKRPIEKIAADVKKALADVKLPDDYYWRFGGGFEELLESKGQLAVALLITVFLVYMVMACLFENYLYPFLIMIKILLNFIGIWAALKITHKPLSTQVFIGMIMLAGYSVNAAILLVDHALHLPEEQSKKERFIQAGVDRLRPILMTALAAILGFLPMALSFGQASDLWSPLAVTIIGGLVSSTILILFILPSLVVITDDIRDFFKGFFSATSRKMRVLSVPHEIKN